MELTLLGGEPVADWLCRHDLAEVGEPVTVRALAGGVSNLVLGVDIGDRSIVLKQSLPRLRVAEEWTADQVRLLHEAHALRFTHGITPDQVPSVIAVDDIAMVLAIDHAPDDWQDWRALLLDGIVDHRIGTELGTTLAAWHAGSVDHVDKLTALMPRAARSFEELRVDPFYRFAASRLPELSGRILSVAGEMAADSRRCLVHGDFSPKNILVGEGGYWIVDFEVAHVGTAAFDVAFLMCHLVLKSAHRPGDSDALRDTATAFAAAYSVLCAQDWAQVNRHVACLLLARVHGKSPAGYLDDQGIAEVDRIGRKMLLSDADTVAAAWEI